MPYRRLPNTDAARMRALKRAYAKGYALPPSELAFSQETYSRLGLFINSFELALSEYRTAYKRQAESSGEYQRIARKAKLYVSHFIQVLNMAILREELKENVRKDYGIPINQSSVPSLANDADVVEWGQRIIDGEFARTSQGRTPMQNPSAAVLRVHYEKFIDAYQRQRILQQNTSRTLNTLSELRPQADAIILDLWNEVESFFSALDINQARENAKEYGVTYVYRKNELKDPNDTSSLFSPETLQVAHEFQLKAQRKH